MSNANVENAIIDGFMLEKKKKKRKLFSTLKWFEIKKRRVPENSVWNFYTAHVQLEKRKFHFRFDRYRILTFHEFVLVCHYSLRCPVKLFLN